jgi:hypothetical protein
MEDDTKAFRELAVQVNDEERAMFDAKLSGSTALIQQFRDVQLAAYSDVTSLLANSLGAFQSGMSDALSGIILGTKSASEAFKEFGQSMLKVVVDWITQKAVAIMLEMTLGAAMAAFTAGVAASLAASWAPAAALASLATLGGNAASAPAALISTAGIADTIALTAKPMARGGDEIVRRPTLFLAGEAGPERALFQPLGGPFARKGGGGDVQISFGDVYMQPGSSVSEFAEQLGFQMRRELRYKGL